MLKVPQGQGLICLV